MELSEYIKIKGESYFPDEDQIKGSARALGKVDLSLKDMCNMFLQETENSIPLNWTDLQVSLGDMMSGIMDFCFVNSIDLRQVLDRDIKKNHTKEDTKLRILHKEDEIFNESPFKGD